MEVRVLSWAFTTNLSLHLVEIQVTKGTYMSEAFLVDSRSSSYGDLSDPISPRSNLVENKEVAWKDYLVIWLKVSLPIVALISTLGPSYIFNDRGCIQRPIRIAFVVIAVTSIFFSTLLHGHNVYISCGIIDWTRLKVCRTFASFVSLIMIIVASVFCCTEIAALDKCS